MEKKSFEIVYDYDSESFATRVLYCEGTTEKKFAMKDLVLTTEQKESILAIIETAFVS